MVWWGGIGRRWYEGRLLRLREGYCYEGETWVDVGMKDFGMRVSVA